MTAAGYGGSDRHPGRSVADCVADVAAVADALGLGRFAVMGTSGGGPHSLAVAALLDERVTRAICNVGVAPFDAFGEGWFAGMDPANVEEFGWALAGETRLTAELERESARMGEVTAADPSAILDQFDLAPSDKEVLAREDFAQMLRESVLEETRNGVWGWVDDDIAFITPWGFDLSTITIPVQVRYGTSDVLVPAAHGEWIAGAVPGADVRSSGLGHLGDPDADLVESLGWLTAEDA